MRVGGGAGVIGLLVVACGGGQAPGGSPGPQSLRVQLRFAKRPAFLRYEVHRTARLEGPPGLAFKSDRTLYVTQVFEDSLDAHLIRVRVDSMKGLPGTPVSVGPFPGFKGWFNDSRDRLDTLATDLSIEEYRADVFDGTIPLPSDSVGVGDIWNAGPSRRTSFHVQDTPVHAAAHGVVKRITAVNGDTIAVLDLTIDVKGKYTLRSGREVDLHGQEKGEEIFSVNQGITLRLHVNGSVELDTNVMGPGGLHQAYTIVRSETERSLLPR